MALSDDQKAMLRLLSQRGEQGYEDIAALKGLSVEEVGAQVREAISALEAEGIPAPAIPAPPGEEPAEEAPASPPAPPEKSVEPAKKPEPPAPEPPPKSEPAPAAKAKPAPAASRPRPRRGSAPKLGLPAGKGARAAIAAAIGVVIVVVVILLVSGGGGDSSSSSSSEAASGGSTESVVAVALKKAEAEESSGKKAPTYAALRPNGEGEGLGIAIFGKVKKALALRVVVEGLEQTAAGESYTVWISDGAQKMLPLASTEVTEKGTINAQVEVPLEVLAYLADETFSEVAITRTSEARLRASLKTANKAKKAPAYTGTEVLKGKVVGPIVGAKQRLQEEEAAEKKK